MVTTVDEDGVLHGVVVEPFVRSPYNYDRDAVSEVTGLYCEPGSSVTQQQFKEECDINTIVRNFGVTGQLPITAMQPLVGDFTGITDFQSALEAVREAEANPCGCLV